MIGVQLASSNCQRSVDAISTAVSTDRVSLSSVLHGGNDGTSNGGIRMTPLHRNGIGTKLTIVSSQRNVVKVGLLGLLDIVG